MLNRMGRQGREEAPQCLSIALGPEHINKSMAAALPKSNRKNEGAGRFVPLHVPACTALTYDLADWGRHPRIDATWTQRSATCQENRSKPVLLVERLTSLPQVLDQHTGCLPSSLASFQSFIAKKIGLHLLHAYAAKITIGGNTESDHVGIAESADSRVHSRNLRILR